MLRNGLLRVRLGPDSMVRTSGTRRIIGYVIVANPTVAFGFGRRRKSSSPHGWRGLVLEATLHWTEALALPTL